MGRNLVYGLMGFFTRRRKEHVQKDQSSRNAVDGPTLMTVQRLFCLQLLFFLVIARSAEQEWYVNYST